MYLSIKRLGPAALPGLMQKKAGWDAKVRRHKWLPANLVDRLIQWGNRLVPANVGPRLLEFHQRYGHHLMIKVDRGDSAQMNDLLAAFFAQRTGGWFQCDATEQADAFLVRFAVGGAAVFYCDYHGIDSSRLISIDVALRRNDDTWTI